LLQITFRFGNKQPVRLAYQPPASSIFHSEQTSHQQSASSTFSQNKSAPAISHQPNEQAVTAVAFFFLRGVSRGADLVPYPVPAG
jgi:hypothetical protein